MASLPANSIDFVSKIGKPYGADEEIRRVFLWKYAYYTDGTKTKLDTNYPRFTPDVRELIDDQSNNLFLRICRPTSRLGAPRFPKFMDVTGWIQDIKGNIDAAIQDNPKWARPEHNPP
eukprot:3696078-Heterocapsa_arctica.AAC.1